MRIHELQTALRRLHDVYASGGASKQSGEIAKLIAVMDGYADLSVDDFVSVAREKLADGMEESSRAHRQADAALVEMYLTSLLAASTDKIAFDAAFAALKSDRAARLEECTEIANGYKNRPINGMRKYSFHTKAKAFEFIFDTYLARAQDESKAGIIGRMTRWAASG